VLAWIALSEQNLRLTGALVIELRDFALADAFATQAFDSPAATVAGVYGVLMLLLGAAATQLAPSAQRCQEPASAERLDGPCSRRD
jgi:hypothetical protein